MKKIDRAAAAYQKSGFIKTSVEQQAKQKSSEQPDAAAGSSDSGYSRAAKFLLLIGPDQAAEVLKQFSADDIERIVKEIASVRKLDRKESGSILAEFNALKTDNRPETEGGPPSLHESISGGAGKAREMLLSAFGEERGAAIFNKALPFGGRKPFDFFEDLQPEQILMVLKNEPPYIMSIVLSFLKPEAASAIISGLPPESRKEIVLRIARQGEVAPGIIDKMEEVFRDRIRAQGRVVSEEIDGKTVLADILKHMDLRSEEKILEEITNESSELAKEIKDSIYTIDLLLQMDDRDVQYLLRDFDNAELAVIIKGKKTALRARILDNLSDRRRVMVEEESYHLGEMFRTDVDKATKELINYLMELEQKGLVKIPRGEEEWI